MSKVVKGSSWKIMSYLYWAVGANYLWQSLT